MLAKFERPKFERLHMNLWLRLPEEEINMLQCPWLFHRSGDMSCSSLQFRVPRLSAGYKDPMTCMAGSELASRCNPEPHHRCSKPAGPPELRVISCRKLRNRTDGIAISDHRTIGR